MVVRVHNIGKWSVLKPGEALKLEGLQRRKIRIDLNCPAPSHVEVVEWDGPDPGEGATGTFVAVVQGLETVEFYAGPNVRVLCTSEDDVWFHTNDGELIASEFDAKSFTKLATRKARNPELELMMFKLEQNMMRRVDAVQSAIAAMEAARVGADPETGELPDDNVESDPAPKPADDPATPDETGGGEKVEPVIAAAKAAKGKGSDGAA